MSKASDEARAYLAQQEKDEEDRKARASGVGFFKIPTGESKVRLLMVGDRWYVKYGKHFKVSPDNTAIVMCNGPEEECEVCNEHGRLKNGSELDVSKAERMARKQKAASYILVSEKSSDGKEDVWVPKVWEYGAANGPGYVCPHIRLMKFVADKDDEWGDITDHKKGRFLKLDYQGEGKLTIDVSPKETALPPCDLTKLVPLDVWLKSQKRSNEDLRKVLDGTFKSKSKESGDGVEKAEKVQPSSDKKEKVVDNDIF